MTDFAYERITANGGIAITTDTELAEEWSKNGNRITAVEL